jgi:nitrite reductase/ring-hydroxylating ferredoxin subunit
MPERCTEFDTGIAFKELDPDRPRVLETPWGTMAIFVLRDRTDGALEVVCTQAFCPHLEGPLFHGSVADGCVTCPWHSWRFDLRTGGRVTLFRLPMPGDPLQRCGVRSSERGTVVLIAPDDS